MTDNGAIDPYETVCEMKRNSRYIRECEVAEETLEQIGHLLFRLQNNSAIRDMELENSMLKDQQRFFGLMGTISMKKAEVQAENGGLLWSLKYVRCDEPTKVASNRGRPKKDRGTQ